MKSSRLSVVRGSCVAVAIIASTALDALDLIDFAVKVDQASTTELATNLLSTRIGAAAITFIIAALVITCVALWRKAHAKQSSAVVPQRRVRTEIEEREEVHRIRITRTVHDDDSAG